MSGPGMILLGLMSEHDNRVHASGHGGQADPVLRQDFSLGVVPEVEVGGRAHHRRCQDVLTSPRLCSQPSMVTRLVSVVSST